MFVVLAEGLSEVSSEDVVGVVGANMDCGFWKAIPLEITQFVRGMCVLQAFLWFGVCDVDGVVFLLWRRVWFPGGMGIGLGGCLRYAIQTCFAGEQGGQIVGCRLWWRSCGVL